MTVPDYIIIPNFGCLMEYYLQRKNIKVAELAEKCSLSRRTVSRYMLGEYPRDRDLTILLCDALDLHGDEKIHFIHMAGFLTDLEILEKRYSY